MESTKTAKEEEKQTQQPVQDEEEEVEMTYEEFLVYSARLGEFEDVKFCIDEKVDLAT